MSWESLAPMVKIEVVSTAGSSSSRHAGQLSISSDRLDRFRYQGNGSGPEPD